MDVTKWKAKARHPSYDKIKAMKPSEKTPICNAIRKYWAHMEQVHGATPDDYGSNVLKWHRVNHPECTTLPSYDEAKKV